MSDTPQAGATDTGAATADAPTAGVDTPSAQPAMDSFSQLTGDGGSPDAPAPPGQVTEVDDVAAWLDRPGPPPISPAYDPMAWLDRPGPPPISPAGGTG